MKMYCIVLMMIITSVYGSDSSIYCSSIISAFSYKDSGCPNPCNTANRRLECTTIRNTQYITSINFANLSARTLPTELGSLTHLKHLDLSNCGIAGTLPTQIGLLTSLTYLDLSNNSFNGSIPSLASLKSLDTLVLQNTHFTGCYPPYLYDVMSNKSENQCSASNTWLNCSCGPPCNCVKKSSKYTCMDIDGTTKEKTCAYYTPELTPSVPPEPYVHDVPEPDVPEPDVPVPDVEPDCIEIVDGLYTCKNGSSYSLGDTVIPSNQSVYVPSEAIINGNLLLNSNSVLTIGNHVSVTEDMILSDSSTVEVTVEGQFRVEGTVYLSGNLQIDLTNKTNLSSEIPIITSYQNISGQFTYHDIIHDQTCLDWKIHQNHTTLSLIFFQDSCTEDVLTTWVICLIGAGAAVVVIVIGVTIWVTTKKRERRITRKLTKPLDKAALEMMDINKAP